MMNGVESSAGTERPAALTSRIAVVALVGYLLFLVAVTLARLPYSLVNRHHGLNLVPVVNSIRCFVPAPGQPSTTAFCLKTILGNVLMFVPLGMLLPLVWRRQATLAGVVRVALAASVLIEVLQFAERSIGLGRWTDVDDVLLNVMGAVGGFGLVVAGQRWAKRHAAISTGPDGGGTNAKGGTRTDNR